jgi:hypothetical protein
MPAVLVLLMAALLGFHAAGEQLRLQSATIDAARLLGRGDGRGAHWVATAVAGASSTSSITGDILCVRARAPVALGVLPALSLTTSACVLQDAAP